MRILPFLFLLAMAQQASKQAPPAVTQEIKRLESCRPVFKLSPAPVNLRVVWTQPFDIVWAQEDQDHVSIEFSIQYAQSNSFATREEAERAQDFNPLFDLRQRSHYAIEGGRLRLLWRESLTGGIWKRQTDTVPEFACWQTLPDPVPQQRPPS
jgi:hypothetical protein